MPVRDAAAAKRERSHRATDLTLAAARRPSDGGSGDQKLIVALTVSAKLPAGTFWAAGMRP